jgi:multidrug resistance efflux pump
MIRDEFLKLSRDEAWDYLQNAVAQRDGALADAETASAAKAEADARIAEALAAKGAEHQEALDELNAKHAEMQAFVDACGGTEFAQAEAKRRRKEELQRTKEAAEAELAKLEPSGIDPVLDPNDVGPAVPTIPPNEPRRPL